LELIIKDDHGNSYIIEETIEIQELSNVSMTLASPKENPVTIRAYKDGTISGPNQYRLKLVQDGMFVYGEEIKVTLYKNGIMQRTLSRLHADNGDEYYTFEPKPQGEHGTYELEFSYDGSGGKQNIRVPVFISSEEPLYAREFTFRIFKTYPAKIVFENGDFLDVTLNGKSMTAYKKWYPAKNCYAYAILDVEEDFAVAAVNGHLDTRLPAYIYFPSLDISVGLTVDLDITARALLWTKTLYHKRLANVWWHSGNQKKSLMSSPEMAQAFAGIESSGFELMPREYGSRQSVWLAGEEATLLSQDTVASLGVAAVFAVDEAVSEPNPDIRSLMENIYPEAEPQLVVNGSEGWLVWTDDNPERDAINRTQLRYSVQKGGVWQQPVWLDGDGTADFTPAAAVVNGGVLMAWHNISKAITEEEDLEEMLKSSEISITESLLTADGSSPNIITLTHDNSIDHSPVIASNGSEALLVWIKAEEMGVSMDEDENSGSEQGSQLYFAKWSGGTCSEPSSIGSNNATVLNASLFMEGEQG